MSCRYHRLLVFAALLAALGLRLPRIDNSLSHDEAYTLEAFSGQPVTRLVTAYAEPNNHIFHTLLVRFVVRHLGKENWMVRLPALLAGLAAVPVVYLLGRALFAEVAVGSLAAWLLALLPIHISYSQVARGYSLLVLLTALSTLFLCRALQNNRLGDWAGVVLASFLAAWTLPSGLFHLISLLVWAGLAANEKLRRSLLLAGSAALLLVLLAYLPIRADLEGASLRWGVRTWEDPLVLPQILIGVVGLCAGGWPGLIPALAVAIGVGIIGWRRHQAGRYLAAAWVVPFLVALVTGVGAQPRAYIYLVTGFVLTGAFGALYLVPRTRWRPLAAIALTVGYASTARLAPAEEAGDPYAELAAYLQNADRVNELVITPFIMDVRVWAQARDTLAERLVAVLASGRLEQLIFVTSATDERFHLNSYLLKTPVGASQLSLPPDNFDPLFDSGPLQLRALGSRGIQLPSPMAGAWKAVSTADGAEIHLQPGPPALGTEASLRVANASGSSFQVYSTTPFSTPGAGLIVLVGARSVPDSYLSLYEQEADGSLVRPHLFRTASWPAVARGRDGGTWFIEAQLLPARPQTRYGVYLLCPEVSALGFADMACYFFPYEVSPGQ